MYEDDYSDFFNEMDSLEIPKNTIKSEIYFNIIDSIDSEFKTRDQEQKFIELYETNDNDIRYLKIVYNKTSDFFKQLLMIVQQRENVGIHWIIGYFFENHFENFILFNNHLDQKSISEKIIDNLYYLKFSFIRFVINYLNIYDFCKACLSELLKYLDVIDKKMLKNYFNKSCELVGGVLVFPEKEYDLMMLKLILKASNYSMVDVDIKDIKSIEEYIQSNIHKRGYEEFLISNLIIENIKKRHRIKQGKIYKNEKELSKEQFELIKNKLKGQLFVKDTSAKQIDALFKADFKYLNENKIILNTDFKLGLFHYFIKEFEEHNLFKVYGIFSSLNKFEWLVYDCMVVTSKDINDKKNEFPRGLEIIDGLIKELKKE